MIRISPLLLAAALVLTGCGSGPAEKTPTKEDFAKKPPPSGWRGPGQPGGPDSGPVKTSAPPPAASGGK